MSNDASQHEHGSTRWRSWIRAWMREAQHIRQTALQSKTARRRSAWALVIVAVVVFVLAAYLLNWGWTGFPGNTVWDWMQLLLVPLALNTEPLWFSGRLRRFIQSRRRRVPLEVATASAILVLLLLVFLAYRFNWAFTGFQGEPISTEPAPRTLWDWLNMLLLPTAVAIATIRFSQRHRQAAA